MTVLAQNNSFCSCKIKRVENAQLSQVGHEMLIFAQKHSFACCKILTLKTELKSTYTLYNFEFTFDLHITYIFVAMHTSKTF